MTGSSPEGGREGVKDGEVRGGLMRFPEGMGAGISSTVMRDRGWGNLGSAEDVKRLPAEPAGNH